MKVVGNNFESVTVEVVSTYDAVDVEEMSTEILQKATCDPPCQ